MYECFHCGHRTVIWDADFDPEDYGIDGVGVVHECHCESCGAEITYVVLWEQEEICATPLLERKENKDGNQCGDNDDGRDV